MSVNFEERKQEKWKGIDIIEVWLVEALCQKFSLWSWQNSEKLWSFSRGDLIFLTQREANVILLPLRWIWVIDFTFGVEFASLQLHQLCFSSLSPEFPGVLEQIQGELAENVGESSFAVCPSWVAGECRGQWKRLFMILSFFPIQVEGIFSISHKSRLCGSASRMPVVPKWPWNLTK